MADAAATPTASVADIVAEPNGGEHGPPPPATATAATAEPGAGADADRHVRLLEHAAWQAALQEPSDLVPAIRAQGALLCAELCARAGAAARGAVTGADAWAEAASLGRELEAVAWEGLHSGQAWRDVTEATRRAYAQAQFVLGAHDLSRGHPRECLRRLDMALLMGPPAAHGAAHALAELVQAALLLEPAAAAAAAAEGGQAPSVPPPPASSGSGRKRPRPWAAPAADTVPRVACPSLHHFSEAHVKPQVPVILTGCMAHWPACEAGGARAWRDLGYLKRVAGARTVPVEVGKGTYLSTEEGGWGQRLMTLGEFIDRFVVEDGRQGETETGYLAQHELFEQLPALRRDILVPDYCALEDDEEGDGSGDEGGDVIVNAWFGPAGTVSPAHTDPYHNLLAQVVGAKAVRLFAPAQTPCLYPHRGLMRNNSQVDVKAPDLARFPRFARAAPLHCVLEAGEMLYIPPLWWHHIESLAVSFSVSFWWGRRREMPPPVPGAEEEEEEEEEAS